MLRSFPEAFLAEAEVLIVNNDANESLFLQRMFSLFPKVRIIEMPRNAGFARACNRGVAESRGEILFFLNPDIQYVEGDIDYWLMRLREGHREIIAPMLMKNGKEEFWSGGQHITPSGILLQNIFPIAAFWSRRALVKREWVSGAAFAIAKTDFESLLGFDEQFFLYYEDADLCHRAMEKGISIRFFPEMRFSHRGGTSHESSSAQKKEYFLSQDRYIRKYYGKRWGDFFHILRNIRFFFIYL